MIVRSWRALAALGVWAAVVSGAVLGPGWIRSRLHPQVYTSSGYGGFVPAPPKLPAEKAAAKDDPVAKQIESVQTAYAAGHYQEAEKAAQQVRAAVSGPSDVVSRMQAAGALQALAYSAARRKDYGLARERFALTVKEAETLPNHGKPAAPIGQNPPAMDEEAAYQHAVLTGAMGDKAGAEKEYLTFMQTYPESPLVQGAVGRIGRMHHGNIPKDAEAAWRKAMDTAQEREKERRKETAICGAECLKEMINRLGAGNAGQAPDVQALAKEMKTTDEGSSMADLAATARRHGLKATGLALTQKGLEEQALPLVSLMSPGHYVIVEQVTKDKVSIWDPDGAGQGKGARRTLPLREWKMMWRGVGMTLTRGS